MNNSKTRRKLSQGQDGDPSRASLRGFALALTLCLMAIGGCQPSADPLQKAFDAIGGKDALLELSGFRYESSGERFEPAQGLNPAHDNIKASSFTLSLL